MNYLELINKCLVELNYKQVGAFSELMKNDHKKLKNILNVLSAEICSSDKWDFLLREEVITLPAQTTKIPAPNGRIEKIYADGAQIELKTFGGEIILPEDASEIRVIYYTKNCAVDVDGEEKSQLEDAEDETLIPMPFAEPLLVYGACMRLKGNPQHVRFNYWFNMYKDALANLRSRSNVDVNSAPSVKLFRK